MVFCNFKAVNLNGDKLKGQCFCNSKIELAKTLNDRGYFLTYFNELGDKRKIIFNRLSAKDISLLCSQLSSMLSVGVNISDVLHFISEEHSNKSLKKSLKDIEEMINQGMQLSDSMKTYSNLFPMFLINMIKVGEEAGKLDKILSNLSDYYSNENKIICKIKKALAYPCTVLVVSILILQIMIITVIPIVTSSLAELGGNLPKITSIIITINRIINENFHVIILLIMFAILLIIRIMSYEKNKILLHRFWVNNCMTGKFARKLLAARFSKLLAILIGSGIRITSAMNVVSNALGNKYAKLQVERCIESIRKGESIAKSVASINLFPKMLYSMIRIGEETGNLEDMLLKAAGIIEDELHNSIEKITSLIEPVIIIILSSFIGVILVSMLLPIMSVMDIL